MAHDETTSLRLDPTIAPLVANLPPNPQTYTENLEQTRQFFNTEYIEMQKHVQEPQLPPKEAYVVHDHAVSHTATDNGITVITVRSYRPAGAASETFPAMIWCHGGGFVFGNLEMDDYMLKIIAVKLRIMIASVDYRLAPENPFPRGLYDCFEALKWVASNAEMLGADLSKGFLVAGQSAGANIAAVLAHLAKANSLSLTGQALCIPLLCHPKAYPEEHKEKMKSFVENKNAPVNASSHMEDYYEKLQAPPANPECSPLLYPSLEGLPPAYFQICEIDPVRDEGLVYKEKLEAVGVRTYANQYPGVFHGFHLSFPEIDLAKTYNQDFMQGLRWLLTECMATPQSVDSNLDAELAASDSNSLSV